MITENIGDHILYCCDADELKHFICADLLVTDPPYKLTSGGKNTGTLGGILSTKNYNNNGSIVDCDISWEEICDICFNTIKHSSHAYIMSNNRNVKDMLVAAEKYGFYFHNLLIWKKTHTIPNKYYMKNCEYTGFFKKGRAKTINNPGSQTCHEFKIDKETSHPTEKPVDLMKLYIENSSKIGETVFDPFMGTAATGIACIQSGRKFIGCEKNPKYFNEACERISKAVEAAK